ncbi:hypothetical protein GQX74_002436 [Glossina fuscipes]|nr:hypothetical protein GQX74_002436 [Glossina fuscipes]
MIAHMIRTSAQIPRKGHRAASLLAPSSPDELEIRSRHAESTRSVRVMYLDFDCYVRRVAHNSRDINVCGSLRHLELQESALIHTHLCNLPNDQDNFGSVPTTVQTIDNFSPSTTPTFEGTRTTT